MIVLAVSGSSHSLLPKTTGPPWGAPKSSARLVQVQMRSPLVPQLVPSPSGRSGMDPCSAARMSSLVVLAEPAAMTSHPGVVDPTHPRVVEPLGHGGVEHLLRRLQRHTLIDQGSASYAGATLDFHSI